MSVVLLLYLDKTNIGLHGESIHVGGLEYSLGTNLLEFEISGQNRVENPNDWNRGCLRDLDNAWELAS